MRVSTLLEWGGLLLLFAIAILAVQNIGLFTPSAVKGLVAIGPDTSATPSGCGDLGYGGFYQETIPSPQHIVKQIGEWTFTINPVYRYTVVGRIVGRDEYPLAGTDALAPMDLMIANGEILAPDLYGYFTFTKTSRHYIYRFSFPPGVRQLSSSYVNEHVSNNHVIFADDSVYAQAKTLGKGDFVRLTGYLVTVNGKTSSGRTFYQSTSTTRTDQGEGACEVMYVESIEKFAC
jgi:hypothetical protein